MREAINIVQRSPSSLLSSHMDPPHHLAQHILLDRMPLHIGGRFPKIFDELLSFLPRPESLVTRMRLIRDLRLASATRYQTQRIKSTIACSRSTGFPKTTHRLADLLIAFIYSHLAPISHSIIGHTSSFSLRDRSPSISASSWTVIIDRKLTDDLTVRKPLSRHVRYCLF